MLWWSCKCLLGWLLGKDPPHIWGLADYIWPGLQALPTLDRRGRGRGENGKGIIPHDVADPHCRAVKGSTKGLRWEP